MAGSEMSLGKGQCGEDFVERDWVSGIQSSGVSVDS